MLALMYARGYRDGFQAGTATLKAAVQAASWTGLGVGVLSTLAVVGLILGLVAIFRRR